MQPTALKSTAADLKSRVVRCLGAVLCILGFTLTRAQAAEQAAWAPVTYHQSFGQQASVGDFRMTDPRAWKWTQESGAGALELFTQSKYQPAVRSPVNLALLTRHVFKDFVLDVECQQTSKEYGHRDLCFFFGLKSPTRFYYLHLASAADNHAHNVFIVNEEPRLKIAKETTRGVEWGPTNQWHRVRIERKADSGSIRVFFNDMSKPIMVATDSTFPEGYIGLGSFDDVGRFRNLRIEGQARPGTPGAFFTAP